MTDFNDLLNKNTDEVERVPPLPNGTYRLAIKPHETGESPQKKTPFVRVAFDVVGYEDDVQAEDLEGIDLQETTLRDDFYLTQKAEIRLKEFLAQVLGEGAIAGRTFLELLPETVGKEVLGYVVQKPDTRAGSDAIYNNVQRYIAG